MASQVEAFAPCGGLHRVFGGDVGLVSWARPTSRSGRWRLKALKDGAEAGSALSRKSGAAAVARDSVKALPR